MFPRFRLSLLGLTKQIRKGYNKLRRQHRTPLQYLCIGSAAQLSDILQNPRNLLHILAAVSDFVMQFSKDLSEWAGVALLDEI